MKAEDRKKTKKQLRIRQGMGILLCLLGFFSPFVSTKLFDNDLIWLAIMFGFMILGIIVLTSTLEGEALLEIERQHDKYDKQPLTVFQALDCEGINAVFQNAGFQKENGVWHKRQFSWAKVGCMIHYYARCVSEGESLTWMETLETKKMASKNICIFVFQCYEQITSEDEATLRERAITFITDEVLLPRSAVHTCIPILVDEVNREGCFLENSQGVTVYAYGCKLLKQLFL